LLTLLHINRYAISDAYLEEVHRVPSIPSETLEGASAELRLPCDPSGNVPNWDEGAPGSGYLKNFPDEQRRTGDKVARTDPKVLAIGWFGGELKHY
jgi:hypothetical protein